MKFEQALEIVIDKVGNYKVRGNHLIFETCPFCKKSGFKFYVNINTGAFDDKHGSCGKSGYINTLLKELGIVEKVENTGSNFVPDAVEKKLNVNLNNYKRFDNDNKVNIEYMEGRGITLDTLVKHGVLVDKRTNNISFFTTDNKSREILSVNYRDTNKRISMEVGSKAFLWNRDKLNLKDKTLYITEGRIDALTMLELGYENVVSVPNGVSNLHWIENDWELLSNFEKIYLLFDNDVAGKTCIENVTKRLDFSRLFVIDLGTHKDINDAYMSDSKFVKVAINEATELYVEGIVNINEVSISENVSNKSISTGIKQLDYAFNGFRMKELTILSAMPGAGKSSLLCNLSATLINEGERVFLYSGELSEEDTKSWCYQVIGGKDSCTSVDNEFRPGDKKYMIKKEVEKKIDKWIDNKLYLYRGGSADAIKLIEQMKVFHKRYGIRTFMIDNLSILNLEGSSGNKYEAQSNFVRALADFIRANSVHVILVVHPRKSNDSVDNNYMDKKGNVKAPPTLGMHDISGSADLGNLTHNILIMHRANQHWKDYLEQQGAGEVAQEISSILYLVKNRNGSYINDNIYMRFDLESKRFYGVNDTELLEKKYGWNFIERIDNDKIDEFEGLF